MTTTNAVGRLDHYGTKLETELPRTYSSDPDSNMWPSEGAIELQNVKVCYPSRPDYAVLNNISFQINHGESVGVVGRTGSGKSTLVTALFRLMELFGRHFKAMWVKIGSQSTFEKHRILWNDMNSSS
jgi:ABC-type multidrug transport system fused ATPase/permease subunit